MSEKQIAGLAVDMKISLGNIIVLVSFVCAFTFTWAVVRTTQDNHAVQLAKHEARIERIEQQAATLSDRLTRIEVTLQTLSVQMDRMLRAVENPRQPRP